MEWVKYCIASECEFGCCVENHCGGSYYVCNEVWIISSVLGVAFLILLVILSISWCLRRRAIAQRGSYIAPIVAYLAQPTKEKVEPESSQEVSLHHPAENTTVQKDVHETAGETEVQQKYIVSRTNEDALPSVLELKNFHLPSQEDEEPYNETPIIYSRQQICDDLEVREDPRNEGAIHPFFH